MSERSLWLSWRQPCFTPPGLLPDCLQTACNLYALRGSARWSFVYTKSSCHLAQALHGNGNYFQNGNSSKSAEPREGSRGGVPVLGEKLRQWSVPESAASARREDLSDKDGKGNTSARGLHCQPSAQRLNDVPWRQGEPPVVISQASQLSSGNSSPIRVDGFRM